MEKIFHTSGNKKRMKALRTNRLYTDINNRRWRRPFCNKEGHVSSRWNYYKYVCTILECLKYETNERQRSSPSLSCFYQWTNHSDKKINKETLVLTYPSDQRLTGTQVLHHSTAAEHTHFYTAYQPLSKIDHVQEHEHYSQKDGNDLISPWLQVEGTRNQEHNFRRSVIIWTQSRST